MSEQDAARIIAEILRTLAQVGTSEWCHQLRILCQVHGD